MKNFKVLIVEDEQLIAHSIKMMIEEICICVGIVSSYQSAKEFIQTNPVDLVVIDIRLYGEKTGIDLGNYINANHKIPMIFLTGSMENKTLNKIIQLSPAAYFAKPIQKINLQMAIELVAQKNNKNIYFLSAGKRVYRIDSNTLLYAKADHVYTSIFCVQENEIVIRKPLTTLIHELPQDWLIQINRSVAINPIHIKKQVNNIVYLLNKEFKVSTKYISNIEAFLPKHHQPKINIQL